MNSVVFCFARCQPFTRGHEKLFQTVISEARVNKADHFIFLSQTQDSKENPLLWEDKVRFAKHLFNGVKISEDRSIKTPFDALKSLGQNYKTVILVAGSDRIPTFEDRMPKYLNDFGIENFNIVSAGNRDTLSESIEGISGSKARQYAMENNFDKFASVLPESASNTIKKQMYNKVRQGLQK